MPRRELHENEPMNATLYAERRARLVAALGPNGIAIVPTAPEALRNKVLAAVRTCPKNAISIVD